MNPVIAARMTRLFERGRIALTDFIVTLPADRQPRYGAQMALMIEVVTREDFILETELCLDHAVVNGAQINILAPDGNVTALLQQKKVSF